MTGYGEQFFGTIKRARGHGYFLMKGFNEGAQAGSRNDLMVLSYF